MRRRALLLLAVVVVVGVTAVLAVRHDSSGSPPKPCDMSSVLKTLTEGGTVDEC